MKKLQLLLFSITFTTIAFAGAPVGFESGDTMASVLKRQTGQRVEIRLNSGETLTGKVEAVGEKSAHFSALTGQDFFDAVVVLDDISAVIVRSDGK